MQHGPRLGIPIERTGALLVAWTSEQQHALAGIAAKAAENGYTATRPVAAGELYDLEPNLGPAPPAPLAVPDEPSLSSRAARFATEAIGQRRSSPARRVLQRVCQHRGDHHLDTSSDPSRRGFVNAAGLQSDGIDRLFGHERFQGDTPSG